MSGAVERLPASLGRQLEFLNLEFLVYSTRPQKKDESHPLIIYLHSAAARGADVRKVGGHAQAILENIRSQTDANCMMVIPQCVEGTSARTGVWKAEDLNVLLEYLKTKYPIDERRIYLTGSSMGGYGAWAWAAMNPEHFAAVAPVAGGLGSSGPKAITSNFDQWVDRLTPLPIWTFHGGQDTIVPVDRSRAIVTAIRENGGQAKLTVYPQLGHHVAGNAYSEPEFYTWLLQQQRSSSNGNQYLP